MDDDVWATDDLDVEAERKVAMVELERHETRHITVSESIEPTACIFHTRSGTPKHARPRVRVRVRVRGCACSRHDHARARAHVCVL